MPNTGKPGNHTYKDGSMHENTEIVIVQPEICTKTGIAICITGNEPFLKVNLRNAEVFFYVLTLCALIILLQQQARRKSVEEKTGGKKERKSQTIQPRHSGFFLGFLSAVKMIFCGKLSRIVQTKMIKN